MASTSSSTTGQPSPMAYRPPIASPQRASRRPRLRRLRFPSTTAPALQLHPSTCVSLGPLALGRRRQPHSRQQRTTIRAALAVPVALPPGLAAVAPAVAAVGADPAAVDRAA